MTYLTLQSLLNTVGAPSDQISSVDTSITSNSSSNVASLLQFTIPDGKLYYPEPFIASPSYLHSDITYLHMFQYWYWLWFLFIFLICFFFISFVCTVRWCSMRVRPRRETRGVSRSKCGDLITACVPVSWAISIIVNESADATDLNDGFGTAELVVGVRAYQWGWEYYYPRSIDLNYNVRPSYATLVGNSLNYSYSSGKSLNANYLWRMYQNKTEEQVVTPAHLLLIPVDSSSMSSFLNFKSVGLDTLQASSAFLKIRNSTKIYNSHLVHTPSNLTHKYFNIQNLFVDENNFLSTSSFGVRRQHALASVSALGNSHASNLLDSNSFDKFLNSNLISNSQSSQDLTNDSSILTPLSLNKSMLEFNGYSNTFRTHAIVGTSHDFGSSEVKSISYPSRLNHINDNSDKPGVEFPGSKVGSDSLVKADFLNKDSSYSSAQPTTYSSSSSLYSDLSRSNSSSSSKEYNLSGPNSKVLLADQSIRAHPSLTPSRSNYNLSASVNPLISNASLSSQLNQNSSPLSSASDFVIGYVDWAQFNKLASSRSFVSDSHPPVLSSDRRLNNTLNFDTTSSVHTDQSYLSEGSFTSLSTVSKGSVGDVFIGSREKTPKSINTAYWSSLWSLSSSSNRVSALLFSNANQSNFYLPLFQTYVDYDFRNDQAIDMLEELYWETSFSGYNFYDYMNISKEFLSQPKISLKDAILLTQFIEENLGLEPDVKLPAEKPAQDIESLGNFYSNSVQMDDAITDPLKLNLIQFELFPVYAELNEIDESFSSFKGLTSLFSKFSSTSLGSSEFTLPPRSYASVFNHFRSDYDDFTWSRSFGEMDIQTPELDWSEGSIFGSDLRLSNPASLRAPIRNSVVNFNAFQKVFRPRLDEGRALSHSSSFADLGLRQPFLSDLKVPYSQLLGKNRDSFYSTPLYSSHTLRNANFSSSLSDALNTPMYDFPFLLSRTSDLIRFTWIDWFSRWKHIEVQPSSVSRYSTIGVPYMRKPFDFNSNTGDKLQDTELYFVRVSRSRRNYLTNWSYSPFTYNKAYVWNSESDFDVACLYSNSSLSSSRYTCSFMHWYWRSPNQLTPTSSTASYSSSGNEVYGKSTWRPRTSIAAYYSNTSKLIDILSKREFLYRQFLEQSANVVHLPTALCATPNNPLLSDLKSSFLFSDPANFSSEYSRDTLYSSTTYFKFSLLRNLVDFASTTAEKLPINYSALTNYTLFYFMDSTLSESNKNAELYKSQFRPLKKGISNMLRLHATGAVAMPVEMRLQVLASSRDVIHSWAIPSASVKIDCVPGYTSHRMMKFLLTGVYWGQCQEICGRYHHWMPIVVYFMKRDLFFLWCTHFVFGPSPHETWDISDRRFADLLRFASYDRSSWLNELGS